MRRLLALLVWGLTTLPLGCRSGAAASAPKMEDVGEGAGGPSDEGPRTHCDLYCDKVARCGTLDGGKVSSCHDDCQQSQKRASEAGCPEQFDAVFECVDPCNPDDFSPDCAELIRDYEACLPG